VWRDAFKNEVISTFELTEDELLLLRVVSAL